MSGLKDWVRGWVCGWIGDCVGRWVGMGICSVVLVVCDSGWISDGSRGGWQAEGIVWVRGSWAGGG